MNILSVGTLSSYVKNVALNVKWQQKKDNPQKTKVKQEDPQIAQLKGQAESARKGQRISGLYGKMMAGMRLSDKELEYLRANAPDYYEKAMQIEQEREAYQKELRQCTSKEDVEKLNQRKLTQFCAEAKTISNNASIPEAKKKELLDFLCMRMNAALKEYTDFKDTPEYRALPDRSEDAEARHKKNEPDPTTEQKRLLRALLADGPEKALRDAFPELFEATDTAGATTVEITSGTGSEAAFGNTVAANYTATTYTAQGAAVSAPGGTGSLSVEA